MAKVRARSPDRTTCNCCRCNIPAYCMGRIGHQYGHSYTLINSRVRHTPTVFCGETCQLPSSSHKRNPPKNAFALPPARQPGEGGPAPWARLCHPPQLAAPPLVLFERAGIRGLMDTAVDRRIGLLIAIKVQAPEHHPARPVGLIPGRQARRIRTNCETGDRVRRQVTPRMSEP